MIEKARTIKDFSHYAQFSKLNFDEKYKKFCQLKKEINVKHAESLKKVFGDFSWKQLIGLYLRHSKSGAIDQVEQELDYKNLKFNHEEYAGFHAVVEEASFLYGELAKDSEEIFKQLNNDIFTKEYKWATHGEIKTETAEFVEILKELNTFISKTSEADYATKDISIFSPESVDNSAELIDKIIETLKELLKLYEKGSKLAGEQYDEITFLRNLKYNFLSVFSAKNKDISSTRRKIPELTGDLIKNILKINRFNLEGLKIKKFEDYQTLSELKNDCSSSLENAEQIKKSIKRLKNTSKKIESFENKLSNIEKKSLFNFSVKNFVELETFEKVINLYSALKEGVERLKKI